MSQVDTQENLSEDTANSGDGDNLRFVPVSESIRYRKRAQSAEKKAESLAEQLAEARSQAAKLSEHLSDLQIEQELMHKLAAAGAVDLEAAVLMAKSRVEGRDNADLNAVVEQLKKEKHYLFGGASVPVAARKTAGAKERLQNSRTILEAAAKKAATSGNRMDLHEYLKLRRNFL
jgi:glutamate mutase epsilon subunit